MAGLRWSSPSDVRLIKILQPWHLTDGSLSITPPRVAIDQARQIVAGIDLTSWVNTGGPNVVQRTSRPTG